MSWKKAIGYGLLLWIIIFVVVSIFIAFKAPQTKTVGVVVAIIGGVISYCLARAVKPQSAGLALSYGIIWMIIGLILDLIVTLRFNPNIFSDWTLWLGYAFGVLAPLLAVKKPQITA